MAGNLITERNVIERRIRELEDRLRRFIRTLITGGGNVVYNVTIAGTLTGTSFTLSYSDLVQASVLLVLRGRVLKPGVDFTVVGATLTMLKGAPFQVGDPAASFDYFFVQQGKRGI